MASPLHIPDLLRAKRDGETLNAEQIREFIAGAGDGSIPDYQVAAMLMAVFIQGLDDDELTVWADAMLHSGDVLDLSGISRPKVDKHSTGGVGDKISLPLAPAVASCGVAVPMISGRGLGHSGGTLDKLESIPGFQVDIPGERFIALVEELGFAMIGQTARLAPADRRLYALRDVTSTVESIPLIASSIMSKKLAEGIDALVLDCKVGDGAFMKTRERARALGQAIKVIGEAAGKKVSVFFTQMDAPIGRYVGHALEMKESIEVLRGGGPDDTRELTVRLGGEMLHAGGVVSSEDAGIARLEKALDSGEALALFGRLIEAQGGDAGVVDDTDRLPRAAGQSVIEAREAGQIAAISAMGIARACMALGGGRARKEDAIDHAVGVELAVRVGDTVEVGQELVRLHHNERGVDRARALAASALSIALDRAGDASAAPSSRILEVLR